MITRKLTVVNGLTGQQTPLQVGEGATPQQVLAKLGLDDYKLARVRDRMVLPESEDVARATQDGDLVFAFAKMEVGDESWVA